MTSLLHNRRKYTSGQVVPSGGGDWLDFDLAKLGAPDDCVQIFDATANSGSTFPLRCYNILPFGDDNKSLLLNAHYQGHAYVFDFDTDANSFHLAHIESSFSSRSRWFGSSGSGNLYGVFPSPDGSAYYYASGGTVLYRRPLTFPYNLSNDGTSATILNAAGQGIMTGPNCLFISSDGERFFYKSFGENVFYALRLVSPWPTAASAPYYSVLRKYNLADFNASLDLNSPAWRCFTFSPDGCIALFTTDTAVVKLVLATPWDFSTAAFHSMKVISGLEVNDSAVIVALGGVAVNSTGTRMILHNRASTNSTASNAAYQNAAFYDFALSA